MPGCGPVAVAIQYRSDDASVEHPGKRLVMGFGRPVRHYLVTFNEERIRKPFSLDGPQPKQALCGA